MLDIEERRKRNRDRMRERYHSDPVYREQKKAKASAASLKKSIELQPNDELREQGIPRGRGRPKRDVTQVDVHTEK